MMSGLVSFLAELKKEMLENDEFEFWKYLEQSEELIKEIFPQTKGLIEENVSVKGTLFLGNESVIKSGTRIEGFVTIGDNCVIGPNAFLRNGTVIESNSHIGNCEIKNSIILNGANIPHFSYVGDSIIGENVNFGAGSKVANLRFDNSNVQVTIDGIKKDTGRRKLGTLVNSDTKIGCNAVLNAGTMIGKNCKIFPNTFVNRNLKSDEIFK